MAAGGPAFAENQPLTCWYNDHADFTSAENAAVAATVGAVTRYGSDRIRAVSLGENNVILAVRTNAPALADLREKSFWIE